MLEVGNLLIRTYTKFYGVVDNNQYGGEYTVVIANYFVGKGVVVDALAGNINACPAHFLPIEFLMLGVNARGANLVTYYHRVALFRPQMGIQTSE